MSDTPSTSTAIWRTTGSPLVQATASGPLSGQSVAVKDLFAVAGEPLGAGNPVLLAEATPQPRHADAVAKLLEAGCDLTGIAQTDEFALSLAGTNAHYGTPPNPAAPGRIPGGSTNGSASAVSYAEASIGLGTDTGGSIRVPAAYQGLWGIRTTHGLLPRTGLHPLAESFDTIGWLTRTPDLLAAVADVLVPRDQNRAPYAPMALGGMGTTGSMPTVPSTPVAWEDHRSLGELKVIEELFQLAEEPVARACRTVIDQLQHTTGHAPVRIDAHRSSATEPLTETLAAWKQNFTTIQLREAWALHGPWVTKHWDQMAPDVGSRFRIASELTARQERTARKHLPSIRQRIRSWVGDGVLALPSAASVAPLSDDVGLGTAEADALRQRMLMLTTLAPLAGLPVVNIPTTTEDGLPTGLSLMGPAGSDRQLIAYAAQLRQRS